MKSFNISAAIWIINVLFMPSIMHSQDYSVYFLERNCSPNYLDSMKTAFGKNKTIPPAIELECLSALSYYPELKEVPIRFRYKKMGRTMMAQPAWGTLFKKRKNRKYIVSIQKENKHIHRLHLDELSFNAWVGWIGHELAHIVYYRKQQSGTIIFDAVKYAFPGFRRKFERRTDRTAIRHQLGYALLEGAEYAIYHSDVPSDYRTKLIKYYLSPNEILGEIRRIDSSALVVSIIK